MASLAFGGEPCDLSRFIYRFDVNSCCHERPVASSVERGRRKTSTKLRKIYLSRNPKITRRKNAAYGDIASLNLVCCDNGCLLKHGMNVRQIIRQERQKVFDKPYNEQNYVISKLLQVKVYPSGYHKIHYKIPTLGVVCKTAFTKCYGISNKKVRVILKKMDCDSVCVEPDKRGRHGNNPRRITREARKQVTDFICSHRATESHYRRARTQKLFFESRISMRQMWKEFVRKNPHFNANSLTVKRKGPVLSFSTFRNIFNDDLSKNLGFRKPREDTCQVCDTKMNKISRIKSSIENGDCDSYKQQELQQLTIEHEKNLKESELRFAALKYDMLVLSKKRDQPESET